MAKDNPGEWYDLSKDSIFKFYAIGWRSMQYQGRPVEILNYTEPGPIPVKVLLEMYDWRRGEEGFCAVDSRAERGLLL